MASAAFASILDAGLSFTGAVGDRITAVVSQFCVPLAESNPYLLEMFANRDRQPFEGLLPWSGEFVGKFLTHSVQLYRITKRQDLHDAIEVAVSTLMQYQAPDGYMGPW
jgi:hypothetical protein